MYQDLINEAKRSDILSKELIDRLLESMDYPGMSFINWTIDVLKIIKTRIDRGDKITDAVSHKVYTPTSFLAFVKLNFSSYIYTQVFASNQKVQEKVYFQLEEDENGNYDLIMASSSKEKIYAFISSLNERFTLVELKATGIVYIRDLTTNTYIPFVSKKGKFCRYDKEIGKIVEV